MQAAVDVAAGLGAVLLFPGNVYNFGADMPAVLAPDTPQRPGTEKGRIRVDLEQQLAQATRARGLQAVVIRAGDFFGAGSGSWLDQVIVKKLPQGRVTWPGTLDAPHAWAYLPDLARAFVRVAETSPGAGRRALRMPAFRRPYGDRPGLAGRTDRTSPGSRAGCRLTARCARARCPGG
jgi:nucleoside-diphosphate-sugar epimerase